MLLLDLIGRVAEALRPLARVRKLGNDRLIPREHLRRALGVLGDPTVMTLGDVTGCGDGLYSTLLLMMARELFEVEAGGAGEKCTFGMDGVDEVGEGKGATGET